MIPKPLNEIEWADLEALRDSGREEDDRLEFKREFRGGRNFLVLNDQVARNAVDQLAREAIAFLNANGGDIIIGAVEADGPSPRIAEFASIEEVHETANRLAQSINAVIEPYQSVLQVKAVPREANGRDGAIVIRVPPSLRAPHRGKRDLNAYVRRGKESVPMPMDEIQDLTLRRADRRGEQLKRLAAQFSEFGDDRLGRIGLRAQRFQMKIVVVPIDEIQLEISEPMLLSFDNYGQILFKGDQQQENQLEPINSQEGWKPILRGRRRLKAHNVFDDFFELHVETMHENGLMCWDFCRYQSLSQTNPDKAGVPIALLSFAMASVLRTVARARKADASIGECVLRTGIYVSGAIGSIVGPDMFAKFHVWPTGPTFIPDFEITDENSLATIYEQIQKDMHNLLGVELQTPYRLSR